MAAVILGAIPVGGECSEVAVVVGKKTALILPITITDNALERCGEVVKLSLQEADAKPVAVQTAASASNVKTDDNGEETAAEEGQGRHTVASAAFSSSGQLLAVCGDGRNVNVFCTTSWTKVHHWPAKRRVCTLRFSSHGEDLLLADKTGDIYRFKCREEFSESGELILGHISVLLDIGISLDNRHIFSCDRDDKIRVSRYPNAYNIEAFCLGHTQFVSCIATSAKYPECIFSGSGDSSIIMWQYRSGSLLSKLELPEKEPVCVLAGSSTGCIAAAQEKSLLIHIVAVDDGSLRIRQSIAVQHTVVSMSFSQDANTLWVAVNNPEQPLLVFNTAVASDTEVKMATLQPLLQESLADTKGPLEGSLHCRLDIEMLSKDPMDGMHRYFERKQERLQGATVGAR
ncbi:tRNA (guanine-N(7)-)-methyltransferase non-catalytic subunit WDR4-like [Sycon ciliatum]|uniref:tRNA (guanine-N(7)-)-methyltransferase non-catalytic subunit WDR4-like n=1 Tax=Sycon ciliatum TaxID=27933 RepID=UPI0031F69FE1